MAPTRGPLAKLRYHFGLQAFVDMFMSDRIIAGDGARVVTHTFMPMLRLLVDEPAALEADYLEIRSRREPVRAWDSPRERWRKNYGNFVREVEWALLELRPHFPREQYERVVIETLASFSRLDEKGHIDALNRRVANMRRDRKERADRRAAGEDVPDPDQEGFMSQVLAKIMDPTRFTAFLVGDAEVTELDHSTGSAVMEVPDCAWHTCPKPDSLPRPGTLPQEGCLLVCKGLFEEIFDGTEGLKMVFDPHLPETSCTIRMQT